MPRNITITLADGSQHTYANAPDNVTPAAVTARAMKEFGQSVTNLDGGKRPTARAPAAPAGPPSVRNGFGLGAPPAAKGTPERAAYDTEYNKRFNAAYVKAHPPSRDARLQQAGRSLSQNNSSGSGMGDALVGGIRSFPGVNYLAAAAQYAIPTGARIPGTDISGTPKGTSYGDILRVINARTAADQDKSLVGNVTGQVISGLGAGKLASMGVTRLAASAAPRAAQVGNILQKLITPVEAKGLAFGTRAANAGRAALAGGAGGAAAANSRGDNVVTGAAVGAVAAPVLGVAGNAVNKLLLQPVATALRLPSAAAILRKYVGTTAEEIQTATAAWKAKAGNKAEPTLYEVLDSLKDRESVRDALARMPASARDSAASLVRERGRAIGSEMRSVVDDVTLPVRNRVTRSMQDDLARARGGNVEPGDAELVSRAARDTVDTHTLRRAETDAIMAPHRNVPVGTLQDLIPSLPGPRGVRIEADPEITHAIRSVAGGARAAPENPLSVDRVVDMIQKLRSPSPTIAPQVADDAIEHLQGVLGRVSPEVRAAAQRMNDAYAGRSRMIEGMVKGGDTMGRGGYQPDTNQGDLAQKVTNAFDTPEGQAGLALGQSNQLQAGLNTSPSAVLRLSQEISENPGMQEAITANLGGRGRAGVQIADAAEAQTESARRLAGLGREQQGSSQMDLPGLARSVIGLHPGALPTTKIQALGGIANFFQGIPEGRANQIAEALFSTNPTARISALKMLNNAGDAGQAALRKLQTAYATGASAASVGAQPAGSNAPADPTGLPIPDGVPSTDADAAAILTPDAGGDPNAAPADPNAAPIDPNAAPAAPAPGDDPNVPYGRAVISALFPGVEITEDVRDANSDLGRKNPGSEHIKTQNAVDVRPIPGMTFAQFIGKINDAGYQVVEAKDEVNHPSAWATGPHWHVVVA